MATVAFKNVTAGSIKKGLDFTIRDREFVVLSGPETSALSAVVRLIAGLDQLSTGEIFFDERRVDLIAPKDRDVALLTRDYTPFPRLSVFENLAIGLRQRSFAEAEIGKRIGSVASALSLEGQLRANAQSLPPDQRRFLGLARTMVRQPKLYLFDEPFAGLGPDAARRGRAEIVKLHQRSATIIYATTVASEALAVGTRTIVVADGLIQQDGVAQDIYNIPANLAVAKCFGDLPMNLVAGTLNEGRHGLVFSETGDGTIRLPLPAELFPLAKDLVGKRAILGFRPEDVEIESSAQSTHQDALNYRALVERTEQHGAELQLYLQTGAHSLIVRGFRSSGQVQGGQRVQFRIAIPRAHLFDPESGRRVTREP